MEWIAHAANAVAVVQRAVALVGSIEWLREVLVSVKRAHTARGLQPAHRGSKCPANQPKACGKRTPLVIHGVIFNDRWRPMWAAGSDPKPGQRLAPNQPADCLGIRR